MGTGPSHFVPSLSRRLSETRRLLSRSLFHAARLLSSPLAGTALCVFISLVRPIFRPRVRHVCSPAFLERQVLWSDDFECLELLTQAPSRATQSPKNRSCVAESFRRYSMVLRN